MLDLSGPAPSGHALADVWDLLQWLEANREARRPPPGFPAVLWGAQPVIGCQPEPFFDGRPGEAFAALWFRSTLEERVDASVRLLRLGVRTAQLCGATRDDERFFRGLQAAFGIRQRTGPVPTARQVFKRRSTGSHATSLMDSLRHRFHGHSCQSIAYVVRNFELAYNEYCDVVTVQPGKMDAAAAWTVLWAFLESRIEYRICHEVIQLYWMLCDHKTNCSPLIVSPRDGITAADRVRFFLQYAVVRRPH